MSQKNIDHLKSPGGEPAKFKECKNSKLFCCR